MDVALAKFMALTGKHGTGYNRQPMNPAFNPLDYPISLSMPHHSINYGWAEHIPFGMTLIQMLQPRILVELGVHSGDSYLAFCHAVQVLQLGTACYGVDTWRGDPQTGFYGEQILAALRQQHDPYYNGFSRLVQTTFDEAQRSFPEGSIDLLHIDGFHTYEAVRHDFDTWFVKLSPRAVVLFHDINVRERDFGVWRLWEELKPRYPNFAFKHGHGLGLLAAGVDIPEPLTRFLRMDKAHSDLIANFFSALGSRFTHLSNACQMQRRAAELDGYAHRQAEELTRARAELESGRNRFEHDISCLRLQIDSQGAELASQREQIGSLKAQIREMEQNVKSPA